MSSLNSTPRRHTEQSLSQTEDETAQPEARRPRGESELSEHRRPLDDAGEYFALFREYMYM